MVDTQTEICVLSRGGRGKFDISVGQQTNQVYLHVVFLQELASVRNKTIETPFSQT